MKEKITKLHFKKNFNDAHGIRPNIENAGEASQTFLLFKNINEDEDALDVSIHNKIKDIDLVDASTTPALIKNESIKKFIFKANNVPIKDTNTTAATVTQNDIIIKKGKKDIEAIYQFSIPFSSFIPNRDNFIVIDISDFNNNPLVSKAFTLEFFTETEDNFVNVRLDRPGMEPTADQVLWTAIKENLQFKEYADFIDIILCKDDLDLKTKNNSTFRRDLAKVRSPFVRSQEYNLIKFGTEFYMLAKFGLDQTEIQNYLGSNKMLPYYDIIVDRLKDDLNTIDIFKKENDCEIREYNRLTNPFMIELLWSYWMEQAGLVQSLNIINLRFQNIKGNVYADRLQRFDADPLRPLSHILWGYIQDEQHRLSIPRRINEYDHEYGLILTGRAVPVVRTVDSRVQFLEAFHNLLNQCIFYFRESDDTTRIADAFPILNSLKEVHLLLAEGNHNAYGNLTWTARHEMMIQQYILARPEMREFLGGRTMVPYPETWMDRVDTMRSIQGWTGAGVMYYYELAIHGEQILLSIRYGNWSDVTLRGENAANWAREFRNSIQRYVHAYRAVTGVDLSAERVQLTEGFAVQPAYLIQQRMLLDKSKIRRA